MRAVGHPPNAASDPDCDRPGGFSPPTRPMTTSPGLRLSRSLSMLRPRTGLENPQNRDFSGLYVDVTSGAAQLAGVAQAHRVTEIAEPHRVAGVAEPHRRIAPRSASASRTIPTTYASDMRAVTRRYSHPARRIRRSRVMSWSHWDPLTRWWSPSYSSAIRQTG